MKLAGVHISPFVRKVAVVLTMKGLEYEHEMVIPGQLSAEYLALSPLKKIPVLVDGDFAVPDSSVICQYLEEQYPEPSVLPETPRERARTRFLEEFADTRLTDAMRVFVIERFVNPVLFNTPTDTAKVKWAEEEGAPEALAYLETQVPEVGFLFGAFSLADIALASPVMTAAYGDYKVDPDRWPRFAAFVERVEAVPVVRSVVEAERAALAAFK